MGTCVVESFDGEDQEQRVGVLSADEILNADQFDVEPLDMTDEWGGVVFIRTISGAEQEHIEKRVKSGNMQNFMAFLASMFLGDADNNRLFTTPDQIARLQRKSAHSLIKVVEAGKRFNMLNDDDVDTAEKN